MVDLNKLSMGALRRYQSWYHVDIPNTVRDKPGVLSYIQKHFDGLDIDPENVITNFLKIKKDTKPDEHLIRKSARNKEKHDKRPIGPLSTVGGSTVAPNQIKKF